ncbi:MAG: phospholipid-binding protein MlaC [Alphaproteobacteria bacterium]
MSSISSICFCNNYIKLATVIFFWGFFSYSQSQENPDTNLIILHESLIKIVERNSHDSDFDFIHDTIKKTYDSQKMGRMIVGENWKKQDQIIRDRFIRVFQNYIASNYIRKFSKINKLEFEILNTKDIGKKYKLINVNLLINIKDKIFISYLMHLKENEWKIFDVLIDGSISEVATKKAEFSETINNDGLKGLILMLKKKLIN